MTTKQPSNLLVTPLSFQGIKDNLVNFLKSQDQFKDYDFTGSNLNVIMDILSYNTHYNALYTNVVANESFLDSANTRNSIVSHAKMIGYIPNSIRASRSTIDFLCRPIDGSVSYLTLPAYSPFISTVDGVNYIFYTLQNYISTDIVSEDGLDYFKFTDVLVYEGVVRTATFVKDVSNNQQRFIIPVSNVDTETFKITVQQSGNSTEYMTYQAADSIVEIGPDSNVYWIQEVHNQKFEIYFGDGIIGSSIDDGNIIIVTYLQTNGSDANFAKNFTFGGTITDSYNNTVTITNKPSSFGGANAETNESIQKLAPLNYQAQNRAVTRQDYESILLKDYPSIDSIYVWGGEDNDPPQYGKVFISIKPKDGEIVSDNEKERITSEIKENKGIVTIIPQIVEPDYIWIGIRANVFYDSSKTNLQKEGIEYLVRQSIQTYGQTHLEKFVRKYYESVLLRSIDESEPSIVGSSVELTLKKMMVMNTPSRANYTIDFSNPIHPSKTIKLPSVTSQIFQYFDPFTGRNVDAYFKDDGLGVIGIYTTAGGAERKIQDQYFSGSVNYDRGRIDLRRFRNDSITNEIAIFAKPNVEELATQRNQILLVDENMVVKCYEKSVKP